MLSIRKNTMNVDVYHSTVENPIRYPLIGCTVSAGFPSPAEDTPTEQLDLAQHLIKHPEATFFLRVSGESILPELSERNQRLMQSLDSVNQTLGNRTLFFGSQGIDIGWRGASEHRSPCYMSWESLPIAKAK
jgi:hypothetical protein